MRLLLPPPPPAATPGFEPFAVVEAVPEPRPALPAIDLPTVEVPTLPAGLGASARRPRYAELAALRGLTRAWDALRTAFADPSHPATSPVEVRDLLAALTQFRAAIAHPAFDGREWPAVAPRVFAVAGHAQGLALWRSLTYSQRQSLARDWAIGRATWQARTDSVRVSLARSRPGPSVTRQLRHLAERSLGVPELLPAALDGG